MYEIPTYDKNGQSLESFIQGNNKLLSALGVFSALIVFSKDIEQSHILLSPFLLSILLAGLILVWLEIWQKLSGPLSFRLFLFRYVLLWGGALITLYWILESHYFVDVLIVIFSIPIVFATILNTVIPIIRQFPFTRKLFQIDQKKKTWAQKIFRGINYFIIFILSTYAAAIITTGGIAIIELAKKINF